MLAAFVLTVFLLAGCASAVSRPARSSLHPAAKTDAERTVIDGWAEQAGRQLRDSGVRSAERGSGSERF